MPIPPSSWTTDLQNRYELLDEAGRGGMGVVYKARDRETGEIVALKILKPDIAADPLAGERFLNEVRLSRRITHKNVCRVYEFTRTGNTAYLSMEFVEGESLRSIVERMGAISLRKGIQIARQICAALHEAHSQGIIHRDLKPENVMLDKPGNVKVMDFGIARLLDTSVTATAGGIVGTPAYMAPEQAEGKELDARTDIYAVGLILYEIFTGKPAFAGDSPMVVALKQIRETPAAPRTVEPSLPWELDALIMRCLEKDPAARFQSVEELDAALASVPVGGTTGLQQPVAPVTGVLPAEPGGTPVASAFRRKALLAVAALLVLGAAVAAWLYLGKDEGLAVSKFTLPNGLRVVLSEDHSAPTVSVAVTYDVGAKDDPPGREGLAHLFEHMLFNGSLNVGKGEHQYLVTKEGGAPNGQTLMDQTHVYETLPANQLELALFLEADRMRSLRLDQARLDTERGTVIAERQQRVENAPYGRVFDVLLATTYDRPNYKKHHVGTDEGLRAVTLQEVNDFFRIFYAPNNAVLTVVGDFDPGEARKKIENYFQHIPAQPPAPKVDLSESEQTAERRSRIEDPFAPGPRVYLAYKTPPGITRDGEAVGVLMALLHEGSSSRLHQKLIREREVAVGVGGALDQRKGPGFAMLVLQPADGRDEATLLKAYDDVLAEIREKGFSDTEVARARMRLRLNRATFLQQSAMRATVLGEFELKYGGAELANTRDEWLASITADDVKRVAQQFFTAERRSILSVARGGKPSPPTFTSVTTPATQSVSGVERLNRAPVSKEVVRVSLPRPKETTLENGLTLLTAEDTRGPLVSVRFEIRGAGSLGVAPEQAAVPILAGAMLREGTPSRSSRQIAEDFDASGLLVIIGQGSDPAILVVQATGLSETFDTWFPMLTDVVVQPSFPGDELPVMKRRLVADWQSRRASGVTTAIEIFEQAIYGPGAWRVDPASIERATADQLKAWHRERYAPQNTIVTIAGSVDPGRAEKRVRETLGRWPRTAFAPAPVPVTPPASARVFIVDRPGSVQATLMMGVSAVDRTHPDQLPLVVANRVLGASPSSRLFVKLREERGLTFGAFSQLQAYGHGGEWRAYTDVNATRLAEGVEAFVGELRRIAAEPVPPQEFEDAQRAIGASFAVTLEQLPQVVTYLSTRRLYGLSADYWERFPEKVAAISAADLQKTAAKYMDMSKLQVVAVGDAKQLEPLLAPLGPVTIVK